MVDVLMCIKRDQTPGFTEFLRSTSNRIIKHPVKDAFWGSLDHGRDEFAKCLMRARKAVCGTAAPELYTMTIPVDVQRPQQATVQSMSQTTPVNQQYQASTWRPPTDLGGRPRQATSTWTPSVMQLTQQQQQLRTQIHGAIPYNVQQDVQWQQMQPQQRGRSPASPIVLDDTLTLDDTQQNPIVLDDTLPLQSTPPRDVSPTDAITSRHNRPRQRERPATDASMPRHNRSRQRERSAPRQRQVSRSRSRPRRLQRSRSRSSHGDNRRRGHTRSPQRDADREGKWKRLQEELERERERNKRLERTTRELNARLSAMERDRDATKQPKRVQSDRNRYAEPDHHQNRPGRQLHAARTESGLLTIYGDSMVKYDDVHRALNTTLPSRIVAQPQGRSGYTIAQIRPWAVRELKEMTEKPEYNIVHGGINNFLNGAKEDDIIAEVESTMEAITRVADGTKCLWAGLIPVERRSDHFNRRVMELNKRIRRRCVRYGWGYVDPMEFLDILDTTTKEQRRRDRIYFDGLHLSKGGAKVYARAVLAAVSSLG